MFQVGRDPRKWRLWWMDVFGLLDVDTPRDQCLSQEGQLRFMACMLFLLLAVLSASCAFWSYDQVMESRRSKTTVERRQSYQLKEIEKMKGR
jgi:hypothetical protein